MNKMKLLIPILTGLIVGQIFAEGERPFSIINTLRVGYDDNLYRTAGGTGGSAYIRDTIDFAFNAALSDRTDLVLKSQLNLRTDRENDFYPNLYAVLSHSVSPRLLLQLSEKLISRDRTTGTSGGRQKYYQNDLGLVSTYIVNEKDRIEASVNHGFQRNDSTIEDLDYTMVGAGVAWSRDIRPQRTRSKLALHHSMLEYDNRDTSYDSTDVSLEVNHTFNQSWQGTVMGGITYLQPDFGALADSRSDMAPLFSLAATYSPSPRTRFTGRFSQKYGVSANSSYGARNTQEYLLGVQHDVTAKILAKLTLRFVDSQYDAGDNETGGGKSDEERMDLIAEFRYKINRLNSLELRLKHSEKTYSTGAADWDQNMVDLGWRVEI